MPTVLAISSEVAAGYVGLTAMRPALQALGHDVIGLPTVLLSNHPGHGLTAGGATPPAALRDLLRVLDERGTLAEIDAVITGYLPTDAHVAFAADAIGMVRQRARTTPVIAVDPVFGDWPNGAYLPDTTIAALIEDLVPLADIITPNVFELSVIAGRADDAQAIAAASYDEVARIARPIAGQSPGKRTVVTTSVGIASGGDHIANVAMGPDDDLSVAFTVPRTDRAPNGTGDLFTALAIGHTLIEGRGGVDAFGRATAGVALTLSDRGDTRELRLVAALPKLRDVTPVPSTHVST
ncbi:MAG: bifunctional hydroxymethylpyrimidine kinase/phosphomethylpyrimidine kinase [Pseudomonadota bacterium]